MLARRITSFLFWRKCPWGKWHWRWGYCRCINADLEITRRHWPEADSGQTKQPGSPREHRP